MAPTRAPTDTQEKPKRTQDETHAWILLRTQKTGTAPTYKEIAAWSGRGASTVGRWVKQWVRDGCDPREMGDTPTPKPTHQEEPEPPNTPQLGEEASGTKRHHLALVRALSGKQMQAIRLRADGLTLSEIQEETHTPTDTLKKWFRLPEVQDALQQVVADRHQEAETIRTMTGQKGVLLLGKAIRMLDKRIDELTRQVAVDPENVAKLARAATAAAKTAMDHGGFPKTERVEATITGEVKVEADVRLMAKPEATLEAEAAALVEAMRADEKLFHLLGKATV